MYLLCKLLYTTAFALLSAAPPYLQLYYHDVLRFSSDQIGFVLAIAPFIQSLACPLWTYLVDKKPRFHGAVMALTSLVGGVAVMGIMGVGHTLTTTTAAPLGGHAVISITCTLALFFAFFTLPNVSLVDSAVMKILGPNKILYGEQRLWGSVSTGLTILLVGVLIDWTGNLDMMFWVFGASTLAFIGCALATNVEADPSYGDEHEPLIAGNGEEYYYDTEQTLQPYKTETKDEEDRLPINNYLSTTSQHEHPLLSKATSGGSILSSLAQSIREDADDRLEEGGVDLGLAMSRIASVEDPTAMLHVVSEDKSMFLSFRVLSFLTTTLLFGIVLSMIVNFLFLFMSQDLHTPASWIGWTGPLGGITELICFCFSKQMTEHLGVVWLVVGAHVATIIRCLSYTLLPPDSFSTNVCALALQMLHGVGFGIFWATGVSEMDDLFPPDQRAVAQGILGALHAGLGTGLGALIGGYVYEYYGSLWLFRSAAGLAVVSIIIFLLGRRASPPRS